VIFPARAASAVALAVAKVMVAPPGKPMAIDVAECSVMPRSSRSAARSFFPPLQAALGSSSRAAGVAGAVAGVAAVAESAIVGSVKAASANPATGRF